MKKVKFCLVGAGRAGMVNARNFEFSIAESEVVAVCIGAPAFVHCEAVVKAAEAGKHIYSEKPLSISLEEADKIEKTIKKIR